MYKVIKRFDNYIIYDNGDVLSIKNNIILKPQNNGNGYLKVHLYKNGKMHQIYVHKLVCEHFIDNPHNYKYIDHIDRNKSNNHVSNLRWSSQSENIKNIGNKSRYSVCKKGSKHNCKETINLIIEDYIKGLKISELSKKYCIPRQTISNYVKSIRLAKIPSISKNFKDGH